VNQNEELTAIIRQMQKHALLYSTGTGAVGGEWRPAFLSEWVLQALLVRAWSRRDQFPSVDAGDVARKIARAQRSRIAFESIFPDWLADQGDSAPEDLVAVLVAEANGGSPEACGNFW